MPLVSEGRAARALHIVVGQAGVVAEQPLFVSSPTARVHFLERGCFRYQIDSCGDRGEDAAGYVECLVAAPGGGC